MNGIEALISKLSAETNGKIDSIISTAKASAAETVATFRAKGEADAAALVAGAEASASADIARADGAATLERAKKLLAAKHEEIDAAFAEAEKRIIGLPKGEYIAFLTKCFAAASPQGGESVLLNEKDGREIGEELISAFNGALADKGIKVHRGGTAAIDGGFILARGDVRTDCSVAGLVAGVKNELTGSVAAQLFA